MKKVWKIYDASLPGFAIAIILGLLTVRYSVILGVAEIALTVAFASWKYLYFKKKKSKLLYQVKTVSDELSSKQERPLSLLQLPAALLKRTVISFGLMKSLSKPFLSMIKTVLPILSRL